MADPSPKQWCPKLTAEEFNRQGKENTEREVKKLLEQLNEEKKVNKTRNLSIESDVSVCVSSDNSDENHNNTISHSSLSIDNNLNWDIIAKILDQNNSVKDELHKSQIKNIVLENSLANLETLEYNQRLELGNKNIKIEEFTSDLRDKTEESKHYRTNNLSIKNKLNKYERMNKNYILLCMLLSLIVFFTQIYIRYFTRYRPTIMTWLFSGEDNDYCSE